MWINNNIEHTIVKNIDLLEAIHHMLTFCENGVSLLRPVPKSLIISSFKYFSVIKFYADCQKIVWGCIEKFVTVVDIF